MVPGTTSTVLKVGPFPSGPSGPGGSPGGGARVPRNVNIEVALTRAGAGAGARGGAGAALPSTSSTRVALDPSVPLLHTLWSGFGRYQLTATGNTVLSCGTDAGCAEAADARGAALSNDRWNMVFANADGVSTGASSAALDVPPGAVVRAAYLVWGGAAPSGAASSQLESVRLTAGGRSTTLHAQELTTGAGGAYQAVADVSDLIRTGGEVTVGGIAARDGAGSWGGWSLVVVAERSGLAERSVTLAAGLADGTVDQLLYSGAARIDQLLAVQWEGDAGLGPDSASITSAGAPPLALADGLNPVGDVANSSVSILGRRPAGVAANTFGVDVDVFDTSGGPVRTASRLVSTSDSERRFLGVLAWAAAPA